MIAVSGVALRIIDALWFTEFAQKIDRDIGYYQHGFRKDRSTHSNLSEALRTIFSHEEESAARRPFVLLKLDI